MDVSAGLVFFLGLCVGSFLNVLIDRLPKGESIFWDRSHCDYCHKTLRWFELIPVISWIVQRGRCLRCHKRLSPQYPLIELVTALGFVLLYQSFAYLNIGLLAYWLIFSSLLVIFVSDLKYQIIPDSMVVVGIVGVLLQGQAFEARQGLALWLSAFGAAAFFFLLHRVTGGRGMGLGDVKLAFLLGLLLGYPGILVGLYAAFLTGATAGVILMMVGKKTLKSTIAFGPFLIIGTMIALVFQVPIIAWWKGLM